MVMINFGARKKNGKYVCQDCGALITGSGAYGNHADGTPCSRELFHDPKMIDWSNQVNAICSELPHPHKIFRDKFASVAEELGMAIADSKAIVVSEFVWCNSSRDDLSNATDWIG